jgi:hypothetical protein
MRKVRNVKYLQAVINGDIDRYREDGMSYESIGKIYGMTGTGVRRVYVEYKRGNIPTVVDSKNPLFTPTPLQKLALCSAW